MEPAFTCNLLTIGANIILLTPLPNPSSYQPFDFQSHADNSSIVVRSIRLDSYSSQFPQQLPVLRWMLCFPHFFVAVMLFFLPVFNLSHALHKIYIPDPLPNHASFSDMENCCTASQTPDFFGLISPCLGLSLFCSSIVSSPPPSSLSRLLSSPVDLLSSAAPSLLCPYPFLLHPGFSVISSVPLLYPGKRANLPIARPLRPFSSTSTSAATPDVSCAAACVPCRRSASGLTQG